MASSLQIRIRIMLLFFLPRPWRSRVRSHLSVAACHYEHNAADWPLGMLEMTSLAACMSHRLKAGLHMPQLLPLIRCSQIFSVENSYANEILGLVVVRRNSPMFNEGQYPRLLSFDLCNNFLQNTVRVRPFDQIR